mmetsp:Transcript_22490/g.49663  ORF Transcript_22490/g.49663 Transcript_22490/m.49663 type:complete len:212 (-) Transcript_22490:873-1508(-)
MPALIVRTTEPSCALTVSLLLSLCNDLAIKASGLTFNSWPVDQLPPQLDLLARDFPERGILVLLLLVAGEHPLLVAREDLLMVAREHLLLHLRVILWILLLILLGQRAIGLNLLLESSQRTLAVQHGRSEHLEALLLLLIRMCPIRALPQPEEIVLAIRHDGMGATEPGFQACLNLRLYHGLVIRCAGPVHQLIVFLDDGIPIRALGVLPA